MQVGVRGVGSVLAAAEAGVEDVAEPVAEDDEADGNDAQEFDEAVAFGWGLGGQDSAIVREFRCCGPDHQELSWLSLSRKWSYYRGRTRIR